MAIDAFRTISGFAHLSALLCFMIVAGALATALRARRSALFLQGTATAMVFGFAVLPGGTWLALPLERAFPINPPLPSGVSGIIALGGTERLVQSAAWGQPTLSDPAPIASLMALGRRYPEAKLVFTGGAVYQGREPLTEAQVVRDFLQEIGAIGDRVVYEDRSRSTFENAILSRDLVRPRPDERWILVTQAISMPRAVAVFRHAGWNVIPYPSGYLTNREMAISSRFPLLNGITLADVALHEWGGLVIYYILGYTDELFPSSAQLPEGAEYFAPNRVGLVTGANCRATVIFGWPC